MSLNQFLSHPYTGTGILLLASLAGGMAGDSAGAVGGALASVLGGATGVIGNHVFETTKRKQELREAFDESLENTHLAAASARALRLCIAKAAQQWRGKPEAAEVGKLATEAERQWLTVLAERSEDFRPVWEENLPQLLVHKLAGGTDSDDIEGEGWFLFVVRVWGGMTPAPALNKSHLRTIAGRIAEDFAEKLYDALKQDLETGGAQFGGMVLRILSLIAHKIESLATHSDLGEAKDDMLQRIEAMLDWHFSQFPELKAAIREEGSAVRREVSREADRIIRRLDALENNLAPAKKRPRKSWQQQLSEYERANTPVWQRLPIAELNPEGVCSSELTLSGLYVEPSVYSRGVSHEDLEITDTESKNATPIKFRGASNRRKDSALAELSSKHYPHQVLLGDAGFGKSSVLRNLYIRWALAFHSGSEPGPVPILVEVREFLAARTKFVEGAVNRPLEDIIDYLTEPCGRGWHFERADLLTALDKGDAWLLIDGLDEAFDPATRKALYAWITAFAREHRRARIIVTSRTMGFPVNDWWWGTEGKHGNAWDIHTLAPFDDEQIGDFLDHWFLAEVAGTELSRAKRDELHTAIRDRPYLRPLAEVPLTLTLLCITGQRGSTATGRAALYREAIRIFLGRWDTMHGLPKEKADIALHFRDHGENGRTEFFKAVAAHMTSTDNPQNSNSISRKDLHAILRAQFKAAGNTNPDGHADGMLELICIRNFLLVERSGGTFSFFHRSFLEYFTAIHWEYQAKGDSDAKVRKFFREIIEPRWEDETWHETLRFLFARLSTSETSYGHTVALRCIDMLAKKEPEVVDQDKKHPEPLGLAYAIDFLQEVESTFAASNLRKKKSSAPNTKLQMTDQWKRMVFKYVRSNWNTEKTRDEDNSARAGRRRRALLALAAYWRGNEVVAMEFAELLRMPNGFVNFDLALGQALAVVSPGRKAAYHLLLDIVLAPQRRQVEGHARSTGVTAVGPLGVPRDVATSGTLVVPTGGTPVLRGCAGATSSRKAAPAFVASLIPSILLDQPFTSRVTLAPYLAPQHADEIREKAITALAEGWKGDADLNAALVRTLIGIPQPGVEPKAQMLPPDSSIDLKQTFALALFRSAQGNPEAKAAFIRVLIGVPEAGVVTAWQVVPPDPNAVMRFDAINALVRGRKGDAEVRTALQVIATGTLPDGAPFEKSDFVRGHAKEELDKWQNPE